MGVDGRLFGPQRAAGLEFESPALPVPEPGEDLARYARRIRDQLRLDGPCVLGGVSFGGMVACELAQITQAERVLLIASCTSRRAIPRFYWPMEWISRIIPDFLIRRRTAVSARLVTMFERLPPAQWALIREMAREASVVGLRRIGRIILTWDAPAGCPCPVYQIHGACDRIIPLRGVTPEVVIPDGGHLINMTHAREVNAFLRRHLG
jgi:pimeloyl-ACP methyl ester carboxylesterase